MPKDVRFAGLMASLRAPRVAVVIASADWQFHAHRAIEFLSRIWGGASGVVVPASDGGDVHPAVRRLLRHYDPDYVTTLYLSLSDVETLRPGGYPLTLDGKDVPADERRAFIEQVEANGPQMVRPVVDDDVVDKIAGGLPCFVEDEGKSRVRWVHPAQDPPRPLAKVEIGPEHQVRLETGDPVLNLALGMRRGLADSPTATRRLSDKSLFRREAVSILTKDTSYVSASPFEATRVGLTGITYGHVPSLGPVIVLGRSADDFALAMLWDRLTGSGIWLPFTGRHTRWHADLGVGVDVARLRGDRRLLVTSASLTEAQCYSLMRRIWAARYIRVPEDDSEPWDYVPPTGLAAQGRMDLRLNDKWDERFAAPMNFSDDGSCEMATTFPLIAPEHLPAELRGWVVDAEWPEHPVHAHPSLTGRSLVASDQNPHETFVRAGGTGITFESGRWDWVLAGASRFGQLAQPKLRWPGLLNTLRIVAASAGYEVRTSHPGKVGRITAELWRGRQHLTDELTGKHRQLLDAFVSSKKRSGPIDEGSDISPEDQRLLIQGACVVPFHALTRIVGSDMTAREIREWLDRRQETGAVRMGLVLGCGVCPWVDFYRIDEFGTRFTCKRCGSENVVTQERWRLPESSPRWYYDLHPTVREFLDQSGDVPVLGVSRFSGRGRALDVEFELEIVKPGEIKPRMEIDFAFMTRDGLVLGEAKRSGRLDGQTAKDRVRDARKLIDAAEILAAREICFASTKTWDNAARAAIHRVVEMSSTRVTVSLLERLTDESATRRTVLHNAGGP